jgi:hypothetical protein
MKKKYKIVKNDRGVFIIKKETKNGWKPYMWYTSLKRVLKGYCNLQKEIRQPCFYCKRNLLPFIVEFYKGRTFCFCKKCERYVKPSMKSLKLLSEGLI